MNDFGAFRRERRQLLAAACAAPFAGACTRALAESSSSLVRILVGFPPGQATDQVARLMGEKLGARTGKTYIVENRPGLGGSTAMAALAKTPADGGTMMLTHMSAVATNPHIYKNVGYNSLADFEPVGLVGDLPFVLTCTPSLPVNSVQELVRYAKANPGKLSNASSGSGTVSHLAMEEFKRRAGINVLHVPYKGSSAGLTDVVSGNVSLALETATAVRPLAESGRLKVLAVASRQRLEGIYANIPTMEQQGFANFQAMTWLMAIYPAHTPKPIVRQTFDAIAASLRSPDTEQRLKTIGVLPRASTSPEEAAAYVRSEFRTWGDIVKRSGVTPDT